MLLSVACAGLALRSRFISALLGGAAKVGRNPAAGSGYRYFRASLTVHALATVVGVLIEVPVMSVVKIVNSSKARGSRRGRGR
ncbi:hypothetical protein T281_03720 [Rhodomicrobium udaipurense JA643]|uniref:Uncharacterized protein n=1 Tax=Rhodomicrobium udaipurense TaxID=1202716 RepID=A0A8I1G9D0_9HYPH|nr:hypothetical protein [Rhodomicrobium udaipurense]KAI95776.1 hypothetical protein T281_03720 [Rhodomicrobium udaipurense JA643]MBJ7542942.1 hypothetical protein [Rhodomicrobium udaipurense]